MTGYRESESVTMCDHMYRPIVVPFVVHECTNYYDKNRPNWEQMEKLAITVTPAPLKPVGFKTGLQAPAKVRIGPDPNETDNDD